MTASPNIISRFLTLILIGITQGELWSQSLPERSLDKIKKSTVFINVKHQFVLTNEDIHTSGTGFFISDRGLIVTNYHVIQSSLSDYKTLYPTRIKEIKVIRNSGTSDYKKYDAVLVSIDKKNDLALLAIRDTAGFPYVEIDTSRLSELKPVWIFGYPFGEEFTVLQRGPEITVNNGSVSALRHDDLNELNRIQVDAVINHGNSGGPVVNEQGKVVGVINSMMGSSRINFAVPAHYLVRMNRELPVNFSAESSTPVKLKTVPEDATVFIDWKKFDVSGKGEKESSVPNGLHTVSVMKKGFIPFVQEVSFYGTYHDTVRLLPEKSFVIPSGTALEEKPLTASFKNSEDVLLNENFDDKKIFDKWDQNTGGEKTRTWYLEDGTLHQYENNGVLHAIYLGDKNWDNYTVRAKVKISDDRGQPDADSRAGIIFRETEDGFYLLRIHQESNKAQLAYHSKNPFGWFIITEKKIEEDIVEGKWYGLSASVHGDLISCSLNDVNLFAVNAAYSSSGRVGFYSVESKPAFDSLTVLRSISPDAPRSDRSPSLFSFWFSDNFDLKSNGWYQYKMNEGAEEIYPFYTVDGSFAVTDDGKDRRVMEFTKYILKDFQLNLSVSVDTGNADAVFDVILRKEGRSALFFRFQKKNSRLLLIRSENGIEKVLKEKKLSYNIFGTKATIQIKAEGSSVRVGSTYSEWLGYEGKTIPLDPGRIGFASEGVRLAFHQLTLSSVPLPENKKPKK